MIPRTAHFVFGLEEQRDPFHFLHYLAIESCRRQVQPDVIYFHHKYLPWGPWWDRVEPHLELLEVELVDEVLSADYSVGTVPTPYRYAHHADFIRLDALIEHGGIYADIDTAFVRPFRSDLFEHSFVIGAEPSTPDERTGQVRESLCNALMMSEPGARFAQVWRERMASELNGTWSNHSGFLASTLSLEIPETVHVEPQETFFPFPPDRDGLARILTERHRVPAETVSIHLWAHLWWERSRRDYSRVHSGWCVPSVLRRTRSTLADLAEPYLQEDADDGLRAGSAESKSTGPWLYVSLDESSGYGIAADRCRSALEDAGVVVDWIPFVPGRSWGLAYEPAPTTEFDRPIGDCEVVITHLVPEFFPAARERLSDAFLVGHTVWETDRIPEHWVECLDACDLIVVPSTFCAASIAESDVRAPVAIVPHVARAVHGPLKSSWAEIPREVFVFYTIAEWNERKAVGKTIEAYLRAFSSRDPVLLVVKTSHLDNRHPPHDRDQMVQPGTSAWEIARLVGRHKDPPRLIVVIRDVIDQEIEALHQRGDCFVSLSRGEGWGLGAFDAATFGNPVVTTGFGGQLDYLGSWPYLVDFELVPVDNPAGYPSYSLDQRWAEPDVDHGAELLRQMVHDREDAKGAATVLATEIRERYQPETVATTFVASVAEHRNKVSGLRSKDSVQRRSS